MFRFDYYQFSPSDEGQYFFDTDVDIPVADPAAYEAFPDLRWMYNKMNICDSQNVWNRPDGYCLTEDDFPLFRKPITNLYGMSIGADVVPNLEAYRTTYSPGHFVMPVLEGEHYSTDFAVIEGKIQWSSTFKGIKDNNGSFIRWEHCSLPNEEYNIVQVWCYQHFACHIGIVNLEMIGDTIIEAHPRMSPQFVDLYGNGWLECVVDLYRSANWDFDNTLSPVNAYSIPIRTTNDGVYSFDPDIVLQAHQCCHSIQNFLAPPKLASELGTHDNYSYVLAVLNGFTLEDLSRAKQLMISGLQSQDNFDHPGDFCF